MKKIIYVSFIGLSVFSCGPSTEELDAHEKKQDSVKVQLDTEWEKDIENMAAQAGDTVATDSTKK